ncbi:MAG TPA: hypothetical protein VG122_15840 [Gemmata sp.]|jgi:hypothetical protein|nr:hypothetical protein [Gemmata sp.]
MKRVLFGLATVALLAGLCGTASAQAPPGYPQPVVPAYQPPVVVGGTIVTSPSVVVPTIVAPPAVVVSPVLPTIGIGFGYPYYGRPYYYPHYYHRRW